MKAPAEKRVAVRRLAEEEPDPERREHHLDPRQERQFRGRHDPAAERVEHEPAGEEPAPMKTDQRMSGRGTDSGAPARPAASAPAVRAMSAPRAPRAGHR
jgi:hypothetical protein